MKRYFTLRYWKGQRLLLLAFLLLHVIVAAIYISNTGLTADEPDYYTYAARWAHGNVERSDKMYDSKSPIVAVALIPRIIKQLQQPGYKATDNGTQDTKEGRYFMVVFTLIIAVYLFVWIRRLFGATSWILPLLFFLFEPTVISYSMIITSDMATGACLTATMYHLYRFYETRQRGHFFVFATWLGISFVCKASLLFLSPLLALLYLFLLLTRKIRFKIKPLIVYGLLTCVIAVAVINISYVGKDSFHSLSQMGVSSTAFRKLASTPVINKIPIPVPANYVDALDLLQYHSEIGAGKMDSTYPGLFVNGNRKQQGGFWYYYLFIGLFKIPIAILLVVAAGLLTLAVKYKYVLTRLNKFIWFLFPAIFFFIILSCFNSFQLGFRHFLLVYPLLFISIAAVLAYWRTRLRFYWPVVGMLFIYMMASVMLYFSNFIPYTNEFLVDKKNAFRLMRDASLDYGQSDGYLRLYLLQNPDVAIPPDSPKAGKYIVTMTQLLDEGPYGTKHKYTWLLNFQPIAHYKFSMFIFHISEEDVTAMQQKSRP